MVDYSVDVKKAAKTAFFFCATPGDSSDYPRKWTVAEPSPVSAWWIMQDLYCEKRINSWKGMEGYSIIIKNLRSISEGAELT